MQVLNHKQTLAQVVSLSVFLFKFQMTLVVQYVLFGWVRHLWIIYLQQTNEYHIINTVCKRY